MLIFNIKTDLVEYISEISDASVKERRVFTIALSGGSLIGLLGKLAEAPYNKAIDWVKWYIFWTDERVVAKSHADSNYKLAKDGLLTKFYIFYQIKVWMLFSYFQFMRLSKKYLILTQGHPFLLCHSSLSRLKG